MKHGFFSIEDVKAIEAMALADAKKYCLDKVKQQPNARRSNIDKATLAINRATDIANLMLTISNFVLAHPSENLKTI